MQQIMRFYSKFFPLFSILPVSFIFIYQSTVYFGSKLINSNMQHYDLTTKLDTMIPIVPFFSIIYLGCYIFWAVNYLIASRIDKVYFYKFITSIFIAYTVCGIIFVLFPTYIDRPNIPNTDSLGLYLMNYVFTTDTPNNLFPSMHCLISWFCFIGIRGQREIPKWYQWTSCIIAILVFISTLVIKQHFIVDVFAGIVVAELCYYLCMHTNMYKLFFNVFEFLTNRIPLLNSVSES